MTMSSSENDSDWSDIADSEEEVVNGEEEDVNVSCLFCTHSSTSVEQLFAHISSQHELNFKKHVLKLNLDFYNYIKFVNYLRKNKPPPETVESVEVSMFSSDEWLMPVIEDDLLLQYDVECLTLDEEKKVPSEVESLKAKLGVSEERARLAEEFLERTIDDLNKCRKELNTLLLGGASSTGRTKGGKALPELKEANGHGDVMDEEDHEGYFSSYAHYGIHEEMIKDKVRTESYRSFILNNGHLFKGSRVLDVGCGTSILSMFASEAGAKEVIGVDNSEIAYQAMDIVLENKLNQKIDIQKGKAEDLKIEGKVDVIISEWMGYFLLFESMLDTVIYCRDNYLSESGCLYPDKCNISLVALDDDDLYNSKVVFWGDVYGYKMAAMRKSVIEEPLIGVVKKDKVISKAHVLKKFDLMKVSVADLEFESPFSLEVLQDGQVSALVGYFDVDFEHKAKHPVRFSTSPSDTPTHWKQTVFFFKEAIPVKGGEIFSGRLKCRKNKQDSRSLDVTIDVLKEETVVYHQKYCMG